jgi:hypothetical protein
VGAEHGYVYVSSEYPAAVQTMRLAVAEAAAAGHLGRKLHGTTTCFDVEVVEGAGSYVAGEETGILSGFHSASALAPEEGIGVIVFSNTSGLDGRGAPTPLATMLLLLVLGLSVDPIRIDIPPRPEAWSEICERYGPARGPVTNLSFRVLMGVAVEVAVQRGHLMLKPPIPAMRRGFRPYPDDPDDPWVFRIYFPELGWNSASPSSGWNSVWRSIADLKTGQRGTSQWT